MFCRFDRAQHWARRALSTADPHDVASRSAALRVLGVVEVLEGDLDAGLEHGRAAVDAGLAPHRWALANAMLAMILFEMGHTEDALSVAQDGATISQRAGFETSFGTFHAGVAARCLVRLGRWAEADLVLGGASSLESTPIGGIQLDAAAAPLAARRGRLESRPTSPNAFVAIPLIRSAVRSSMLRSSTCTWPRGNGTGPSTSRRALSPEPGTAQRLVARYTAGLAIGAVERALDQLARLEAVDVDAILFDLGRRIEVARAESQLRQPGRCGRPRPR